MQRNTKFMSMFSSCKGWTDSVIFFNLTMQRMKKYFFLQKPVLKSQLCRSIVAKLLQKSLFHLKIIFSAQLQWLYWGCQSVWPDLAKFCHFWQICDGLFLIWQNAEPTLANLWHYWANPLPQKLYQNLTKGSTDFCVF